MDRDLKELLSAINAQSAKDLVVGGYAFALPLSFWMFTRGSPGHGVLKMT